MSDYHLRSQISDLERKVKNLEPRAKKLDDLTKVLSERMGMDSKLVSKTLALLIKDDNELVTAHFKQLFSTARLVYSEELQAYHAALIEHQKKAEADQLKRAQAEATRIAELDRIHNENVLKASRNTELYQARVREFASKYRQPVLWESISHADKNEIAALTLASRGKLKAVRCGLLWSKLRLEGESPVPQRCAELWMFYHDRGMGETLEVIPNRLFYRVGSYGYHMGRDDKQKRYFKDDFK